MQRSDFKLDDRVEHVTMGKGRVIRVAATHIVVKYDDKSNGEYNDIWFESYPDLLKREAAP